MDLITIEFGKIYENVNGEDRMSICFLDNRLLSNQRVVSIVQI